MAFCDALREPADPCSRIRDPNGRFLCASASTTSRLGQSAEQCARKKNLRGACKSVGMDLFEKLLDVGFLLGERNDCVIAASSGNGAYARIVEDIFKQKYRVPPLIQYQLTRTRYYNGAVSKSADNLPRMFISDTLGKRCRVRIFRGRRFPKITRQATDMKGIWDWISCALSRNVLRNSNRAEVYDIIRGHLDDFNVVGKRTKANYPSRPVAEQRSEHDSGAESPPETDPTRPEVNGDTAVEGLPACPPAEEVPSAETTVAHEERNNAGQEFTPTTEDRAPELPVSPPIFSGNDLLLLSMVDKAIETAENDQLFLFLCRVDDENSECKIGLVAGRLLDRVKKQGTKVSALVMDVLKYGHEKHSGVSDIMEYHRLRERIHANVEMLKHARAWLGLRPYEQMQWSAQKESLSPETSNPNADLLENVAFNTAGIQPQPA